MPNNKLNHQLLLNSVTDLISLAEEAMSTMAPAVIGRLRSSALQFIMQVYGNGHHFYNTYKRIERIDSQFYLNQIKGLLQAVKDNIQLLVNMNGGAEDSYSGNDSVLTGKILFHFYKHDLYNWKAICNLIEGYAEYFDYTIADADRVYKKLLERCMIVEIAPGVACITEEGKKLYEGRYMPAAVAMNTQQFTETPIDNNVLQTMDKANSKPDRKVKTVYRDNFTKKTIETIAKRVGFSCSNPGCRIPTIGAHNNHDKTTVIGQAAHISAAAAGGPRFDASLSAEARRKSDNGIWLCCNCATLIDKDPDQFPISLLKTWKADAEEDSRKKINGQLYNNNISI